MLQMDLRKKKEAWNCPFKNKFQAQHHSEIMHADWLKQATRIASSNHICYLRRSQSRKHISK